MNNNDRDVPLFTKTFESKDGGPEISAFVSRKDYGIKDNAIIVFGNKRASTNYHLSESDLECLIEAAQGALNALRKKNASR